MLDDALDATAGPRAGARRRDAADSVCSAERPRPVPGWARGRRWAHGCAGPQPHSPGRSPAEMSIVDQLAREMPRGTVQPGSRVAGTVKDLVAAEVVRQVDATTVELPREVALAVRGDRPIGDVHPFPPESSTPGDRRRDGRRHRRRSGGGRACCAGVGGSSSSAWRRRPCCGPAGWASASSASWHGCWACEDADRRARRRAAGRCGRGGRHGGVPVGALSHAVDADRDRRSAAGPGRGVDVGAGGGDVAGPAPGAVAGGRQGRQRQACRTRCRRSCPGCAVPPTAGSSCARSPTCRPALACGRPTSPARLAWRSPLRPAEQLDGADPLDTGARPRRSVSSRSTRSPARGASCSTDNPARPRLRCPARCRSAWTA